MKIAVWEKRRRPSRIGGRAKEVNPMHSEVHKVPQHDKKKYVPLARLSSKIGIQHVVSLTGI